MPSLTLEETETVFRIVAADRSTVHISSDDPVLQRRIEAIGATLVREEHDYGNCRHYTLPAAQLSLRNPSKPVPEAQRLERAARLAAYRIQQAADNETPQPSTNEVTR